MTDALTLHAFTTDWTIESERPNDASARELLLDLTMGYGRLLKSSENIRRGRQPSDFLALAARDGDGELIGTVRLWDIDAGEIPALLLGPLAVAKEHAGAGIGSALMREAISRAERLGHGAILLVGDPVYYQRFGFTTERTGCLAMPGAFEQSRLLALELVSGWLHGAEGMIAPRNATRLLAA